MITIYNEQKEVLEILENVNDYRQLLLADEFLISALKVDAKRAIAVLGSFRSNYTTVYWRRNDNERIFKDFVIHLKA